MTVSNCFCKKSGCEWKLCVNGEGVSDKNFQKGRAKPKKWENLSQIFLVQARDGVLGIKVVLREYNSIKIYFPIHIFISQPFLNVHKQRKRFFTVLLLTVGRFIVNLKVEKFGMERKGNDGFGISANATLKLFHFISRWFVLRSGNWWISAFEAKVYAKDNIDSVFLTNPSENKSLIFQFLLHPSHWRLQTEKSIFSRRFSAKPPLNWMELYCLLTENSFNAS